MASSFMGLFVQRDGLNYAQKALDITGSNLLNSKVEGYSRQRLDLKSAFTNNHCLGYVNQVYLAGAGVEAQGVTQIRSEIYDDKYRVHNAIVGKYTVEEETLSHIENALDDIENETTGFAHTLQTFRDSWQAFSSQGTDQTDLANITKNCAQTVIDVLKNFNNRLENVRKDAFDDFKSSAQKVNSILRQCAAINSDIKSGYVLCGDFYQTGFYDGTGNDYQADTDYGPLEAKDLMNNLIDDLSEYGNVSVKIENDGTYTISMAGKDVVKQDEYAVLTYDVKYKANPDATAANSEPKYIYENDKEVLMEELNFEISEMKDDKEWRNSYIQLEDPTATNGFDADLVSDLRNSLMSGDFNKARNIERMMLDKAGASVNPKYVPVFSRLDNTAGNYVSNGVPDFDSIITQGKLRGQVDLYNGADVYATDHGKYNGANTSFKGIPYYKATIDALAKSIHDEFNKIYTANGIDNFKMFDFEAGLEGTAEGLILSQQFKDTPILAVHPEGGNVTDANYLQIANTWVNRISSVFDKKHSIGLEGETYTFEEFVKYYGNTVGTQISDIKQHNKSEGITFDVVAEARQSIMGVSTDEEGVHMLVYQKWYNAMSRMTTTLDDLLDKLINNTGRVGL